MNTNIDRAVFQASAKHRSCLRRCGGGFFALVLALFSAVPAQAATFALGTASLLQGPTAGTNSVVLAATPATATWTASTNAAWLRLSAGYQSGTGSTNVIFSWDPNPGPTRTGTLTIAGLTLAITQAGSTYVQAPTSQTALWLASYPFAAALDGVGNVYVADTSSIDEWFVGTTNVTTLNYNYGPYGVAVDASGNVYFGVDYYGVVDKWTAANSNVTTVASVGTGTLPFGVALDSTGNVYFAEYVNGLIYKWTAANSNLTMLVSSGLSKPAGVALDAANNVYFADSGNNAIKEWTAVNSNVTTLVSSGLNGPWGVAVDGSGNVYIADSGNNAIKKRSAITGNVSTLVSSGLDGPSGVTVDGAGNLYISDTFYGNSGQVEKLPYAFVDPTPKLEGPAAGSDTLPPVLPTTESLLYPFVPTSSQPWLTITGVTNGVVSFSFAANTTTSNRTTQITLLGQSIPVTQSAPAATFALGATSLLEGPTAGTNSVVLAAPTATNTWTASTNATWLHLSAANQSGRGSTNVIFSWDPNPGPTRTGTLTIAGLTLTITQAGSTYVQAPGPLTTLVASGLVGPEGIAVDGAGNLYIADYNNNAIKEWAAANNTVTTLVSSNLNNPYGVAVDGSGNVYIADYGDNAIKVWSAHSNTVATLVPSSAGLNGPAAVAVDGAGNVYIADYYNNAIKKWTRANDGLTTLVGTGLNGPEGVAVDAAGNVYIADAGNTAIKKWTAANSNVTTLVSSNLIQPNGVAVDGAGNVYIADYFNIAIEEWTAASNTVTTLISSGLNGPHAVAVNGAGNVYIADYYGDSINEALLETPYAFVDPTPKSEMATAGTDVLPVVLPSSSNLLAPFAPTSDSPWLAITGASNGVVSFTFSENLSGSNRTANITLLGQTIPVTQTLVDAPTLTWPTPAPIIYGTALSSNQLDATENVAGAFTYTPPTGTVLTAGTHALSTVFAPSSTNSPGATGSVSIVVLPATLTVAASNATRLYGQANPAFTGSISGLVSGDNISATYACNASTNSPVGIYAIVPSLVDPSGRLGNYATALVNGTLTVTSPSLVINSQPQSQSVSCGSTVALSVGVTGSAPFYYQWRRDARIVPGYDVPVCCQGMLTLSNVDTTFSGIYQVVVSNGYGSVISSPAALSVLDSTAYSLSVAIQGSNVVFSWPETCDNYVLQSASNLNASAAWTTVPMPRMVLNGRNQVTLPVGTGRLFCRIKKSYNWDDSGLGVNWTDNGPALCGRLVGIVASPTDPNTLLVSSAGGGVWRSTDGGNSWAMPGDYALGDFTVVRLEWDRIRSGRLFASTYSDLYATTDLGDHWDNLTGSGGYPAPPWPISSIHPTVPEPFAQLRYSATQSTVFWSKPCLGLYYSNDGSTFTQTWPFPGGSANLDNCIIAIGADDASGYVFFSTMAGNLYRSDNAWSPAGPCLSWVNASGWVNYSLPEGIVCSIAYGGIPNSLAVLLDGGSTPKVYTTMNDGAEYMAWSPTPSQVPGPNQIWDPRSLVWPAPNQFLFGASIANQTTDGGNTWNKVYCDPMHADVRAFYWGSYQAGNYLWMTTDGTFNDGSGAAIAKWSFTPGFAPSGGMTVGVSGISTWQCYYMVATGNAGGTRRRIFLGAQDNFGLASDDNGTTWTTDGIPPGDGSGDYRSLVVAPSNPNRAYSRASAPYFDRSDNAFIAPTCAKVTWTKMSTPFFDFPSIVTEAMTAVDPLSVTGDHVCFAGFNLAGNDLAVSSNGGSTWTMRTLPNTAQPVCVYYDESGNLYAGTLGNGAYVSTDDGITWSPFGLNSSAPVAIMRIAHSSAGGGAGTFFLATTSGLYRMLPGGSWTFQTYDPAYTVSDVEIDPKNPMRVCIAMGYSTTDSQHRGGVLLSTDNGTTFTSLTAGMSIHQAPIAAVQFDPVDSSMIHAATYGLGGWTYHP
jgi:DNA-binding beta-propeller fold protein YncE